MQHFCDSSLKNGVKKPRILHLHVSLSNSLLAALLLVDTLPGDLSNGVASSRCVLQSVALCPSPVMIDSDAFKICSALEEKCSNSLPSASILLQIPCLLSEFLFKFLSPVSMIHILASQNTLGDLEIK